MFDQLKMQEEQKRMNDARIRKNSLGKGTFGKVF
jgi:hypothetical protein